MAKVPNLTVIKKPEEAPEWFGKFLEQLNPFLLAVTDALNGKLSLVENIQAQVSTINIQTNSTGTFRPATITVPGWKPKVVMYLGAMKASNNTPSVLGDMAWRLVNTGVEVNGFDGLELSTKYKITILLIA